MGKHGPCRHCGVTSTPLWRNGPPDKPVLCNACGSRWRTKGSLTNYTPMHARELLEPEDSKVYKVRSISFKLKEQKLHKPKQTNGLVKFDHERPYCGQNFKKILEEDTSNRSSSGSAISFSESCAQFGGNDDLTGSAQSNVWDSLVPSRKRTCVARPMPSPVEKLTKDLYSIMHEQQSSYLSGSSEEDLLYESETPYGTDEIGHGGLLIRHPNLKSVEEESEASSIPADHKPYVLSEAYSGTSSFHLLSGNKIASSSNVGIERLKRPISQMLEEHAKRDKLSNENFEIIRNRDSPLCSANLQDVINFEVFMTHLTHEDQQNLMRHLPSVDTSEIPECLKSMFCSSQFLESFSYYQEILREGIFDLSLAGVSTEECRSLKRLVLLDLDRTKWGQQYKELKERKTGGKEMTNGPSFGGYSSFTPVKRLCDSQNQKVQEMESAMRSPKRASKFGGTSSKAVSNMDGVVDNEGSYFLDSTSMLISRPYTDDSSELDLLLDAPNNMPTPELLCHSWKHKTSDNASPAESIIAEGEESLSNFPK